MEKFSIEITFKHHDGDATPTSTIFEKVTGHNMESGCLTLYFKNGAMIYPLENIFSIRMKACENDPQN